MVETYVELTNPAVRKVVADIPTMQRWEILRRSRRPLSVAELSKEAQAPTDVIQGSLDDLLAAGIVSVVPATSRRPEITYRSAMDKLFVRWSREDRESFECRRNVGEKMRSYSRGLVDDAMQGPEAINLIQEQYCGALAVQLTVEDANRIRDAFRSVYTVLAEADRRTRAGEAAGKGIPYVISFDLVRLPKPDLPVAEFYLVEAGRFENERKVVESVASKLLTAREFEVAEHLAGGKSRPEIARLLGVSGNTIASTAKSIYRKLEVSSRAELASRMRSR